MKFGLEVHPTEIAFDIICRCGIRESMHTITSITNFVSTLELTKLLYRWRYFGGPGMTVIFVTQGVDEALHIADIGEGGGRSGLDCPDEYGHGARERPWPRGQLHQGSP